MTTHRPSLLRLATQVLHMRDGALQEDSDSAIHLDPATAELAID